MNTSWEIKSAKKQLSKMIDETLANGPQIITSEGVKVSVMLSVEEFQRLRTNCAEPDQNQCAIKPSLKLE